MTVLARSKIHLAASVLVAALLSLLVIHNATYKYRAQLRVTPAESSAAGARGMGQLGGLAAAAGLALPTNDNSPFALYVEGVTSSVVAARLADNTDLTKRMFSEEWDARRRRFVEPKSTVRSIAHALRSVLGFPIYEWQAPNEARVRAYLEDHVSVEQTLKSPVVTLAFEHQDPAFAMRLLSEVHRALDTSLREKARRRAEQNIAYLSMQLQRVTLAEHREAVAQALSEQVKARMLASSSMSFAAEPFGSATTSFRPVTPNPAMVLMLGIVLGLTTGLLIVVARWHLANYRDSAA